MMARAFLCGILLGMMCLLHTVSGQATKHPSERTNELVEQFKTTTRFWKQFEVAKQVVALHDKSVLQELEPWLSNEDMHLRGNAAFIFASLGDDRGFQVIKAILENRSPKPGSNFGHEEWGEQSQSTYDGPYYPRERLFGEFSRHRCRYYHGRYRPSQSGRHGLGCPNLIDCYGRRD